MSQPLLHSIQPNHLRNSLVIDIPTTPPDIPSTHILSFNYGSYQSCSHPMSLIFPLLIIIGLVGFILVIYFTLQYRPE